MTPTLRTLLTEIIDYAGLFPPAQLPLEPAISNYARYRADADSWMLARFVCPLAKLPDLANHAGLFAEQPLRLSVLLRGGATVSEFAENTREDVRHLADFARGCGAWSRVESFEVKLPTECAAEEFASLFGGVEDAFRGAELPLPSGYYEFSRSGDWRQRFDASAAAFGQYLADHQPPTNGDQPIAPALKLRTGGLEAAAFPTSEDIAFVLERSVSADVPVKFTAGLHHPFYHYAPSVRANMHGFINVFVAGILASAHALSRHDIRAILEEQDPRSFQFSEQMVGWNDAEATLKEVEFARRRRVISFGSCSFDEPREDLRAVGWMD